MPPAPEPEEEAPATAPTPSAQESETLALFSLLGGETPPGQAEAAPTTAEAAAATETVAAAASTAETTLFVPSAQSPVKVYPEPAATTEVVVPVAETPVAAPVAGEPTAAVVVPQPLYGAVGWRADEQGLEISSGDQQARLRWSEITRAGLVQLAGYAPERFPAELLPGLDDAAEAARDNRESRELVFARGRRYPRARRIPVIQEDAASQALVDEVRQRLGKKRWVAETPVERYARVFGLRNPWWLLPLFVLLFLGGAALLALIPGVWVNLTQGRVMDVSFLFWLGLLWWGAILAAAFGEVQRRV